ncbi:MAG TPA: ABC transporter permease [Chitinophagaceae bacterium]|nr:ABC transporter permease [Chitinophagaceae bacterium]
MNLLKTEWLKIRKYPAFWWIIGITALSYPGINFISYNGYQNLVHRKDQGGQIAKFILGNPFTFPEVWHTVAYFSSWFVFIPAVVVIMLVTNEYTYKTNRQNIIDGWSRNEFMVSKLIDVLIVTLLISLLCWIVAIAIGIINSNGSSSDKWSLSYYAGLFALQTFSQLSLAFLVGFLVRKAFIALGIFIFYFIVLENIAFQTLKYYHYEFRQFLPLAISNRLIPQPAFFAKFDQAAYNRALSYVNPHILYTVILSTIIWLICFRVNNKRDL